MKSNRRCEGCGQRVLARFRTLASRYLCVACYQEFLTTGYVPAPDEREEEGTR